MLCSCTAARGAAGTLVEGDMHHACFYFLMGLPNSWRKALKLAAFPFALALAGGFKYAPWAGSWHGALWCTR